MDDTSSREDQNRISVDTGADFERVKAGYTEQYLADLDAEIRAQGLEHMRDALVAHAHDTIKRTFELAQPNLRINGQQFAGEPDQEGDMEPFDEALDRQIWSLADSRLGWHKSLGLTRRTVPQEIEGTLQAFHVQSQAEMNAPALNEMDVDEADPPVEIGPGDAVLAERHAKISDELYKAMAMGGELDQRMPSQTERSQRFEDVSVDVKESSK